MLPSPIKYYLVPKIVNRNLSKNVHCHLGKIGYKASKMCVKTLPLHQHHRGYLDTLESLVTTNNSAL